VEVAPFFVRRLEPVVAGVLHAWLADGRELEVAPSALERGAGEALFLRLPDGGRAVLLRPAQASVAPLLQEDERGFALELGGVRVPLCESW
jgi:hypothetical protein